MTRLLSLLCAGLIAAIVAEVSHPWGAGKLLLRPPVCRRWRPAVPDPRATGPATPSLDQWTRVVLARPLFAPNRKPSGEALTAGVGLPRLAGIIASPDAAVAIFQPAGSVRPVTARSGDSIAGWR